jgi:hypothetical protein
MLNIETNSSNKMKTGTKIKPDIKQNLDIKSKSEVMTSSDTRAGQTVNEISSYIGGTPEIERN